MFPPASRPTRTTTRRVACSDTDLGRREPPHESEESKLQRGARTHGCRVPCRASAREAAQRADSVSRHINNAASEVSAPHCNRLSISSSLLLSQTPTHLVTLSRPHPSHSLCSPVSPPSPSLPSPSLRPLRPSAAETATPVPSSAATPSMRYVLSGSRGMSSI